MYAEIALNEKAYALDRTFCYSVPEDLRPVVRPGSFVAVAFGKYKKTEGVVVSLLDAPPENIKNIKPILKVLTDMPVINEVGFAVARFVKEQYFSSFYDALRLVMPSGMRSDIRVYYRLRAPDAENTGANDTQAYIIERLKKGDTSEDEFSLDIRKELVALKEAGIIDEYVKTKNKVFHKIKKIISLSAGNEEVKQYIEDNPHKKAQVRVLEYLLLNGNSDSASLAANTGCQSAVLSALKGKGLIEINEETDFRNPFFIKNFDRDSKKEATPEQKHGILRIIENVKSESGGTILIRGVTGSGKTEVYLQAIEEVIRMGKRAILLVPEIALTPQMIRRFFSRFGKGVAVIHSGLSANERFDQFRLITSGEVDIVIGARSAIFAPISNLGVIIVDEEHERTYKSDSHPRYDAVEIAAFRARHERASLVLASATPTIVNYHKAVQGDYELIRMENRYHMGKLPEIKIEDMRNELKNGNFSPISASLSDEINKNLANKEQTILFLNRRGYSTFVSCRSCGFVAKCPNCELSLTYHQSMGKLVCHYCAYERMSFTVCPVCESKYIKHFGKGTEKIEEEIIKAHPEASLIRMDGDTTTVKNAHEKILDKFEKQNIDILLGTQMVSKGLDFANVTLSAVLNADGGLFLDDYRASERTFSQITQVCGRAGRGEKGGRAIVQTYSPDHYAIKFAKEHDYESFYETEIILRKQMHFPPYCDIITIVASGEEDEKVRECIQYVYRFLSKRVREGSIKEDDFRVFRPSYAPIPKIKGHVRMRILIKSTLKDKTLLCLANEAFHERYNTKEIKLVIDVNPVNML